MIPYKLLLFDVDGTLSTTKSGRQFRTSAQDWELLPGRIHALTQCRNAGQRLAICTNQGGVAFGYLDQERLLHELQLLAREVGISEAGVYVCYTHPTASLEEFRMEGDVRRKPGPGMLLEAMRDFEASPEQTLFIGDRAEDQQAAKNAGIDFTPAGEFFS